MTVIGELLVASASRGISDRPYSFDEHRLQLLERVHECHFFHQRSSPLRPACGTLRIFGVANVFLQMTDELIFHQW
ncbi:hypothetical protein TRIUR3_04964 [Triticum urartu]|uniref:Uncharacterized protein n=1 Tax=Triticum urartu TaxID=4572 RepID=M7ZX14_TRIUA|nr:hypothetical protein TRIUR3_04964 [Triticum urartu]